MDARNMPSRRQIPSADPSIREAVAYARLIGAETSFSSMYWPDRLMWTKYVDDMEDAYVSAAEKVLGEKKTLHHLAQKI